MTFEAGLDITDLAVELSTTDYRSIPLKVFFGGLNLGDCPLPFTIEFAGTYATTGTKLFTTGLNLGDCPLPFTVSFSGAYVSNTTKIFYNSTRIIMSSLPGDGDDSGKEIVFGLLLVADFDASQFRGGAPLSVIFEDTSYTSHAYEDVTEINQWHWDFDDGNTSVEQNPTHIFTTMGEYDVTLTVTTTDGRTANVTKRIYVAYIMSYRLSMDDSDLPGQFGDSLRDEAWTQEFDWDAAGTILEEDNVPMFTPEVFE